MLNHANQEKTAVNYDSDSSSTDQRSAALPAWARAAKKNDNRAQPWKKLVTVNDDPTFAEGEDLSIYYKIGMTLCAGEGSLAA